MELSAIIAGLLEANHQIQMTRFNRTQFEFPLADAKLVRVSEYLKAQIAEIEVQQWLEAGMDVTA
jgi:hypothetical protein